MKKFLLSLTALSLILGCAVLSAPAVAEAVERGFVSVNTSANTELTPDIADISIAIQTYDSKSLQKATTENKEISQKVLSALKVMINPLQGDYVKTMDFSASGAKILIPDHFKVFVRNCFSALATNLRFGFSVKSFYRNFFKNGIKVEIILSQTDKISIIVVRNTTQIVRIFHCFTKSDTGGSVVIKPEKLSNSSLFNPIVVNFEFDHRIRFNLGAIRHS